MKNLALTLAMVAGAASCLPETSCVAEGTRVATPDGDRPIEGLRVGDVVLVADPQSGALSSRRIEKVASYANRPLMTLDIGSAHLRVTAEHPIWVNSRSAFVRADQLRVGDVVCIRAGDHLVERVVEAVRTGTGVGTVFDLTVEGPEHTFFADDILVHNKSPVTPACPDGTYRSPCTREDLDASQADARSEASSSDAGDGSAIDASDTPDAADATRE